MEQSINSNNADADKKSKKQLKQLLDEKPNNKSKVQQKKDKK